MALAKGFGEKHQHGVRRLSVEKLSQAMDKMFNSILNENLDVGDVSIWGVYKDTHA